MVVTVAQGGGRFGVVVFNFELIVSNKSDWLCSSTEVKIHNGDVHQMLGPELAKNKLKGLHKLPASRAEPRLFILVWIVCPFQREQEMGRALNGIDPDLVWS